MASAISPERNLLFRPPPVIPGSGGTLFEHEPVEAGGIKPVCTPPSSDCGLRRYRPKRLFTRQVDEERNETVVAVTVDGGGKTDHRCCARPCAATECDCLLPKHGETGILAGCAFFSYGTPGGLAKWIAVPRGDNQRAVQIRRARPPSASMAALIRFSQTFFEPGKVMAESGVGITPSAAAAPLRKLSRSFRYTCDGPGRRRRPAPGQPPRLRARPVTWWPASMSSLSHGGADESVAPVTKNTHFHIISPISLVASNCFINRFLEGLNSLSYTDRYLNSWLGFAPYPELSNLCLTYYCKLMNVFIGKPNHCLFNM